MECLNLRFVRIGSQNTVRTARTPHRAITASCVWFVYIHGTELGRPDWKQYNGSINNYHFTDELVLTEGQLQYGTTTISSFQQNFGVITNTINDNDMLSYSLTTMMCFLTKEWYGFPAYTANLFIKAYHKITCKEDLKSHKSDVSLRWYAFLCGFGSDVLFTI